MKVTIIVEGNGLDLDPIRDVMELVAFEKERYLSEWVDIPEEIRPPKLTVELVDIEIDLTQTVLESVRQCTQDSLNQNPIVAYLYNKIRAFDIPMQNIVGLLIHPNRFEIILEINHGNEL